MHRASEAATVAEMRRWPSPAIRAARLVQAQEIAGHVPAEAERTIARLMAEVEALKQENATLALGY